MKVSDRNFRQRTLLPFQVSGLPILYGTVYICNGTVPYSFKKRERILAVFEFREFVESVVMEYVFHVQCTFKIVGKIGLNALSEL